MHTAKMTLAAALAAAFAIGGIAVAQEPGEGLLDEDDPIVGEKAWMVRTGRMEGAAGNVREVAVQFRETVDRIGESGRLMGIAELAGTADELNRRVAAATLAADVLDQKL